MGKAEKIEFRSWNLEFHATCRQAMSCALANRERTGALTKNKGVLRFLTGNGAMPPLGEWRRHKKTMVPRCMQWNIVAEEEEAKPVACGAHPRSHPFLEDHGTQVGKPACRSPAGQPQAGKPARRRLAGLIPKLRVPGHAGSTREGARGRG